MEGVEIEEVVECAEERGKLGGFGVEFVTEEMVVKKGIDTERAEDERNEGGDVTDEVWGDFESKKQGSEKGAGKVGGVSHTS